MTETDHQRTSTVLFNASHQLTHCFHSLKFIFACLPFSRLLSKQVQADCEFIFGTQGKAKLNPCPLTTRTDSVSQQYLLSFLHQQLLTNTISQKSFPYRILYCLASNCNRCFGATSENGYVATNWHAVHEIRASHLTCFSPPLQSFQTPKFGKHQQLCLK